MKLDRNTNLTGTGKYSLVNRRKVRELGHPLEVMQALSVLERAGVLHNGNEGPGEQFFVMKYKDTFTAPALRAYGEAVALVAARTNEHKQKLELEEYALEIYAEYFIAAQQGRRIPD